MLQNVINYRFRTLRGNRLKEFKKFLRKLVGHGGPLGNIVWDDGLHQQNAC